MTTITTPSSAELNHTPGTRLVFGVGALDQLGILAKQLDAKRVMIISDPGVTEAGHTERACSVVIDAGLVVAPFTGVHENPTTLDVSAAVEFAKAFEPDLMVGLGGGSALDTAKGCNFIYTNGGQMADYHHADQPLTKSMLAMIAVPTTHGTGSEAQSYALIADQQTHMKMACGDPAALPKIALLDPELTLTQPPSVAACTSIDALTHAVEAFVCTKRNEVSCAYAAEAFKLVYNALPKVLANPGDLDARGDVLLGAAYAGLAIENSMLGAAHSAANPLSAKYGVIHGQAVGLMLPHVIRYNLVDPDARKHYDKLAKRVGLMSADALPEAITARVAESGLKTKLSELGAKTDDLPALAEQAAKQWTAGFNPRKITADGFAQLYLDAFGGQA